MRSTNRAATFVGELDMIWYSCYYCVIKLNIEYRGSVILVCEYLGSVADVLREC